jgi:ankyrin repeat protein
MLHYAARLPGAEVIEKLANRGALLQAKNVDGWCALHVAADRGNLEAIQVCRKP